MDDRERDERYKRELGQEPARIQELIRRCAASRQSRRAYYELLRTWYERGTESAPRARYNKIRPHIDRVASYLFAPDTVRFGVHLPPATREPWLAAATILTDEFRSAWADAGADLVVVRLLEWALVYGATVGKVQADPATGFRLAMIQPYDFGVSREDVAELDEQDTLCHWYTLSLPQVERWASGAKDAGRLLTIARESATPAPAQRARSTLVVSGISGTFPNSSVTGGFPGQAEDWAEVTGPIVDEPIVSFVDCWERREFRRRRTGSRTEDRFEDWLVTTMIEDHETLVVRRRNPDLSWTRTGPGITLPAEHPFGLIVPRPLPDYLWGVSELVGLRQLQGWIDQLLEQMGKVVARELDPATFFSGVSDWEEVGRALNIPGGAAGTPDAGAKMETLRVQLGEAPFKLLKALQDFFADASGIPEVLQGEPPSGVRATGQLGMLAGIGAGRIRKEALIVEDAIGVLATKGFHVLQRHDTTAIPLPGGGSFLLSQLPPGLSLRVSAHSSSPIYAEQTQAKASLIRDMIPPEDFIELVDPPGRDDLKRKATDVARGKAEMVREKLRIQEERALRGRVGRPPA